jgi:hypothetical protein
MFVLINIVPFLTSILPIAVASEFMVMVVKANMFPINEVPSPMVAEPPTCQKTLLA